MSTIESQALTRPPKVLAPLIQADLERGDEAGLPYYRAAGEKLLEAKAQLPRGEFIKWAERNFDRSMTQLKRYMIAATATNRIENAHARSLRHATGESAPAGPAWRQPVRESIQKLDYDMLNARKAELDRQEEKKALHDLKLRLIDIGFKVLAVELHPDRGGSPAAMTRLNKARAELRLSASI